MTLSETLPDMELTLTTRQLAGALIRDEIARQRLIRTEAAERMTISPSTLARAINGDPKIGDITLRQIEGGLDLPWYLLTHVIDGNTERIRALDMDPNLREHILAALAVVKGDGQPDEGRSKRRRDA